MFIIVINEASYVLIIGSSSWSLMKVYNDTLIGHSFQYLPQNHGMQEWYFQKQSSSPVLVCPLTVTEATFNIQDSKIGQKREQTSLCIKSEENSGRIFINGRKYT